jgi:hypothetical protein
MRGIKHTIVVGAALVAGLSFAGGCGGNSGGAMGGIGGSLVQEGIMGMLTPTNKNQQQAHAEQQAAAQQAANSGGYAAPQPTEYKAPAMDMTGTLVEKKTSDGASAGWTFMQEGSAVGMPVDVSRIESDARAMAGKKVILTGRYDTQTAGEPKLVAESLSVAGQ